MKRDVSVSWPNLAEISSRTPSNSFSICCLIKSHSLTASSQSVEACQLSFADNGVDLAITTASHGVHKHFADGSQGSCSGDDGTPMKLAVDRGALKFSKSVECVASGTVRVNLGCSKSALDLSQLTASRLSEKRFSLGDQGSLAQRLHDSSNEDAGGTNALTVNSAGQKKELLKFVDNAVHLDRSFSSTPSIDVDSSLAYFAVLPRDKPSEVSRERLRQIRASSMVVPAITPRLPLMGLLPKAVGKASNDKVDLKSIEKVLKLRSSRKHAKVKVNKFHFSIHCYLNITNLQLKEKKQHVWLQCQEKVGLNCDICNKTEGNSSFVRCTECHAVLHSHCKTAANKASCSRGKSASKHSSVMFQTRPLSLVSRFSSFRSDSSSVIGQIYAETSNRSGVLPQSADCVVSILPDGAGVYTIPDAKWEELGLWSAEADGNWWSTGRGKVARNYMSSKEVKRQDIIHELVTTERHHCITLVLLKHTYFDGLLGLNILTNNELNMLMPHLELLLEVHLHFLQLLKKKVDESVVVNNVHEIFIEQFTGEVAEKMKLAYTTFCSRKDFSVQEYHRLCQTNQNFNIFMENMNKLPYFKARSLPDCLLLVTQRLSKYHSFVESLRKNTEDALLKDEIVKAEQAVKKLVANVDQGIGDIQLQQLCKEIVAQMDTKESTTFLGKTFTKNELLSSTRTLLHAGDVYWQNAMRKPAEVKMLLFSDIIVFLQRVGNSYAFFSQDNKECIISLLKLIVREKAGRSGSQGLYLISAAPSHAEMYEIICHTKKMLASWTERIQRAVDACPSAAIEECPSSESVFAVEHEEQLKNLFGKVNDYNDELKKLLDCQIEAYGEILQLVHKMNIPDEEERMKIMKTIDECLPAKLAATAVARFADLMSQLVRERCKQQLLNLACPADTATAQTTTTSSDGSNINRSQTFHGMRNDSKKSKLYRKRVTVSGIPQRCEENRVVETATDNGMSGEIYADSKSAFCAVMSRLKDAEIELDGMKHEKAMLLIELEKEKSIRSSSAQNVYNAGLEELRRLHSDFEKRRSEFQQLVDEKECDFEHRENAIREKEERLNREDSELQSKWQCLREAWEKLQLSGVPIRSLTSPLALSTSSPAYFATCSSSISAFNPVDHPATTTGGDGSSSSSSSSSSSNCCSSGLIVKQSNSTAANSTPVAGVDVHSSSIPCVRSGVSVSGGSQNASAEKQQSFRKVQVPPYLLGSFVHSGRLPDDLVRQQLPSKLLKDDMFNSLSSRFQSSMKERRKGSPKVKDNHSINVKGKQK
ncbi:Rho guanine nucleotide exchange factor 2 [Trichinella pseudospiralis]|uniref:Rho guanine nucleotide exchange factor 2 n=1 Tax=Trichinella pseudospiralis TaxID=6337 RepID=A0A0V1DVS6_TRIPS|nr:Rho guanine nucleotide exchange factor 2 [Trichinella pseudospiralis]